jgi:hypothetical protein
LLLDADMGHSTVALLLIDRAALVWGRKQQRTAPRRRRVQVELLLETAPESVSGSGI